VRICLVITELDPGGAERALVRLACGLQERNIDVFVVSLKPLPRSSRRQLVDQLDEQGIPITSLDIRNRFAFLRGAAALRDLLDTYQPDLVHSFLHHANILCAMSWRRQQPWKLVAGYRVADPSRWRSWLEKRYKRRWVHYTAVSEDVATHMENLGGIEAASITTIPNGIDIERFRAAEPLSPEDLGTRNGRRLLGFVGRLHPQKGLDSLLPHLSQLFDQLPEHDLVIVGDGPRQAALTTATTKLGLENRVLFSGWRDDIPNILAAMDILLLPSRWEGMPNVIMEAMASGLPVVSFDVHGVRELLGDKADDQVVRIDDYPAFCQKVSEIATSNGLADELNRANSTRIEYFSIPAMVDRHQQLYEQLGP
jgi:glycosyltransferase involved in cell wall biosynthesis